MGFHSYSSLLQTGTTIQTASIRGPDQSQGASDWKGTARILRGFARRNGQRNMDWSMINLRIPSDPLVIKHGKWTSLKHGGFNGASINGGFAICHVWLPKSQLTALIIKRKKARWRLKMTNNDPNVKTLIRMYASTDTVDVWEILHQLKTVVYHGLSHYLQGFNHPKWSRISSIHRI